MGETNFNLPFEKAVEQLEIEYLRHALTNCGNKTEAACMLGISVRVLHYKIKKHLL